MRVGSMFGLLLLTVASCGIHTVTSGPESAAGSIAKTDPTIHVNESVEFEGRAVKAAVPIESFTHTYSQTYALRIETDQSLRFRQASPIETLCGRGNHHAGPFLTIELPDHSLITTDAVAYPNKAVPTAEFPGRLPAGDYRVHVSYYSTATCLTVHTRFKIKSTVGL